MDSEPVAYSLIFRNMDGVLNNYINTNTTFATREKAETYGKGGNYEKRSDGGLEWVPNTALDPVVIPLYRHSQPAPASEPITVTDDMAYAFHHALTDSMIGADDVEEIKTGLRAVFANLTAPVVSAKCPERLPCSVLLEPGLRFGKGIKTSTVLAALARRAVYESDMAALSPEEKAEFRAKIADFKALMEQPAPVVPHEIPRGVYQVIYQECGGFVDCDANAQTIWDACRAAMLNGGKS
ncbi:TPA: hypothetical protein ACHP1R_005384 [Raoultella ornithinolytica]